MKKHSISLGEIQSAEKRIAPWIHTTHLKLFHTLSEKVYALREDIGSNVLSADSEHNLQDSGNKVNEAAAKVTPSGGRRRRVAGDIFGKHNLQGGDNNVNEAAAKVTPYGGRRSVSGDSPLGVYLKMENEQVTGSFKIRGALNKVLSLSASERRRILISCSAGNHAQGVAYAARVVGASALIVVPVHTPQVKKEAVRFYGAEVVEHGGVYDESYEYACRLCEERSGIFIHPYLDPLVVAGQGSIGLEILEALPDVDSVIVPIGGGGLIGGIACAMKQMKPECRIYGVVSDVSPAMERLFHSHSYHPERDFSSPGLADGISVKQPNKDMLNTYLLPYVEDVISVTEREIAFAVMFLLERGKTLVEGAGAVSVAGLLKSPTHWKLGKKSVAILSGGNVDLINISQLISKFL